MKLNDTAEARHISTQTSREANAQNPYQIHEVPLRPGLLHLFIVPSPYITSVHYSYENNNIYDQSREYVKPVESGNEEKEICKQGSASVFIFGKIGSMNIFGCSCN